MQSDNIRDDLSLPSLDDEVRRGEEHDHGGHHGVDAQPDQAEPVYHHRRELPVGHRQLLLVLLPRPLGQVPAVHGAVMMGVMVMYVKYLPQFPEDEFDLLREVHVEAERPPGDGAAVERRRGEGEPVVAAVAAGEVVFHRTRGVAHLRAGDRPEGQHHLLLRYIFSYLDTVILFLFHLYLYACIYFNSFIWT